MKYKVTALIPAFNEEKKLLGVLTPLLNCKYLDEVICINDGSTDRTNEIIKGAKGILSIKLTRNYGKAYAIARGIEKATGDIILFIDADIRGLNDENIKLLIQPLKSGKYDFAIGYRCSRIEASVGVPFSGERAYFKKDLLPHIKKFENKGYGLELYLNYNFKEKRKKIFQLKGIYSFSKNAKYSSLKATRLYANTTYQVLHEIAIQKNIFSYVIDSYIAYIYFHDRALRRYMSFSAFRNKILR